MTHIIGVDIGGTFTDIVVFDKETGRIIKTHKVHSTPRNPHIGVVNALKKLEREILQNTDLIFHATTIATNMLLGQLGLEIPRCALITTRGFRDVIEIGRQRRPELYNLFFEKPKPLIPRRYRFEIDERVDSSGRIIKEPPVEEIDEIAERIRENRIISVAISFINSYANPHNEIVVKKELMKRIPDLMICVSTEVDNQYREYERMSTTVVNAVLMPVVSKYLTKLSEEIEGLAPKSNLLVMKSDGGASSIDVVSKLPVSIIESGPASGVIATKFLGEILGEKNLISFDMGGTTAKSGVILDGRPLITTEYEVAGKVHSGRIVKGSGYPVRYPFIDLAEISSGGGSIIWVDEAGGLRVGPISAGADPGPACYGRGGIDPTITDANLILGRIGEKTLLGGEMKIYMDKAKEAFRDRICKYSNYDVITAAIGAIKIANTLMSKILRIITIERGLDPRDFIIVAFGGAGPMHACALAEELGIRKVIVPVFPGVFSALGLVVADIKHTYLRPVMKALSELNVDEFRAKASAMLTRAYEELKKYGVGIDDVAMGLFVDARYRGQGYELLVELPMDSVKNVDVIAERFHGLHERVYGYSMKDEEIEIINIRLEAIGVIRRPKPEKVMRGGRYNPDNAIKYKRECFFETIDDFETVRCV